MQLSPNVVSSSVATEILVTAVVRDEGSGANSMLGWVNGPVSTNGFPRASGLAKVWRQRLQEFHGDISVIRSPFAVLTERPFPITRTVAD